MEQSFAAGLQRPFYDDRLTPYIEIDALRLRRNLIQMQHKAQAANVTLRPHVKTHKSVMIARQQRELGAQGITVSKPSEAIAFIRGGERDLLLAYPAIKAETLSDLLQVAATHQARLTLIADSHAGVEAIAEAARTRPETNIAVAIKVDVGLHRIGVDPYSDAAIQLAQEITDHGLHFAGLLAHAGHAYGAGHPEAISVIAAEEAHLMKSLQARLIAAGFTPCPLSVGATPTVLAAPIASGITEIRPGNYALLDLTACRLGLSAADNLALTVMTRVVAVNTHYAIIDAGSKMLSSDKGPHGTSANGFGIAVDEQGQCYEVSKLSEEHGFIAYPPHAAPQPGSLLRIFPNHSCAVMAQSDTFVLRREDGSGERWPIEGRGQFL